jgi:hypothetical protein
MCTQPARQPEAVAAARKILPNIQWVECPHAVRSVVGAPLRGQNLVRLPVRREAPPLCGFSWCRYPRARSHKKPVSNAAGSEKRRSPRDPERHSRANPGCGGGPRIRNWPGCKRHRLSQRRGGSDAEGGSSHRGNCNNAVAGRPSDRKADHASPHLCRPGSHRHRERAVVREPNLEHFHELRLGPSTNDR